MRIITRENLLKFKDWLESWNSEYPIAFSDYYDQDVLADVHGDLDFIINNLIFEVKTNLSSLLTTRDIELYREELESYVEKRAQWINNEGVSMNELKERIHSLVKISIDQQGPGPDGEKGDVEETIKWYHEFFVSSPELIIDKISRLFEGHISLEDSARSSISIYVENITSEHLYVISKALYIGTKKLGITRTTICQILANAFKRKTNENFSSDKIMKGSALGPSKKSMEEVASLLYDLGNIIDDELSNNKSGKYFS